MMTLEQALTELQTETWLVNEIMTRCNEYPYDNLVAAGMAMRLAAAQTQNPREMLQRALTGWHLDLSVYAYVQPALRRAVWQDVVQHKDVLTDDLHDVLKTPVSARSWIAICQRRDEIESCRVAVETWGDDLLTVEVAALDELGRQARERHFDVVVSDDWLSCVSWQEPDAWWGCPYGVMVGAASIEIEEDE